MLSDRLISTMMHGLMRPCSHCRVLATKVERAKQLRAPELLLG